jgi:hypothetical protein
MDTGPKISSGVLNRFIRYSNERPSRKANLSLRAMRLLATPGGPSRKNAFAGQGRQQRQAGWLLLFVNAPLQAFQERLNAFFAGHGIYLCNRIAGLFVQRIPHIPFL